MKDKELIKKLKEYNLTPEITHEIATRIEQLITLSQNGQSAIDTNKRLANKLQMALNDMKQLIQDDDFCKLCAHFVECKGKDCPEYTSGIGGTNVKTGQEYPDFKWDCRDFSWGDCPLQEDKPCRNCKNASDFVWRGDI